MAVKTCDTYNLRYLRKSKRDRFDFKSMDAWFEEEEQLFVHARDPYVRVDVIESSRHIEVSVSGVQVAVTDRPRGASKLAGLICFFTEKDAVITSVDGEALVMPEFDPSWINSSLYLDNQIV